MAPRKPVYETPLRMAGKRVQTATGGQTPSGGLKKTGGRGKSAQAPGQRKKAAGLKSAKTLTKGYAKKRS